MLHLYLYKYWQNSPNTEKALKLTRSAVVPIRVVTLCYIRVLLASEPD